MHKPLRSCRAWLLPLAALLLAACSGGEADEAEAADEGNLVVTFTMAVEDAAQTRAANTGWDDYGPTDDGTAYENAIDLDGLQIFVCDGQGNPIEKLTGVSAHASSATTYAVRGVWKTPASRLAQAKKVMVLANCADVAASDAQSTLGNLSFARAAVTSIPMWGVATVGSFELGKANNLGTLSLLRAMARVKVTLRNDMTADGFTLATSTLSRHNLSGYVLPAGYNGVASTTALRFEGSLRPYASPSTDALDMMTGGAATVYVPEYENTGTSATPATINVRLSHNGTPEAKAYTLRFVEYDAQGKPTSTAYNLQRNHSYEFELYKEADRVAVKLSVRQWNRREHSTVVM